MKPGGAGSRNLRAPFAILPVFLKGADGDHRQESFPIRLEASACLIKVGSRSVARLASMQTRIEATAPLPLVDVDRNPRAFADRADMRVTKIDVPGDLMRIV